jgi:hypothetical protein
VTVCSRTCAVPRGDHTSYEKLHSLAGALIFGAKLVNGWSNSRLAELTRPWAADHRSSPHEQDQPVTRRNRGH